MSLSNLDYQYLKGIKAREFLVDNAHTVRNANCIDAKMRIVSSKIIQDDDGADVDVILYETDDRIFGEIEFNRIDTKPLLMKKPLGSDI